MPKPRRGSNARKIPSWRGTCPLCNRTRVKVLWTAMRDGALLKVCKRCGQ